MSRVEINAGDRHIIVDHDGDIDQAAKTATELWQRTADAEEKLGPAFGLAAADRRWTPPPQTSSMRQSPGPYPIQAEASDG